MHVSRAHILCVSAVACALAACSGGATQGAGGTATTTTSTTTSTTSSSTTSSSTTSSSTTSSSTTSSGPTCGNGMIDPGETCDPPSSCPTSCDDGNACTTDALTGSAAACTAACTHVDITTCAGGDGCCPSGCDETNDSDCSATCGNSVIEPGETCDPPSSCPTSCDDGDACTTDTLGGSAAACTAVCSHAPVTACVGGDGCCPSGCDYTNDSDCACPATTCAAQNLNCGSISDGCGKTLNCGSCSAVQTCGGGGKANVCGGRVEKSLPICSADGWCWDNPSPHGNVIEAAVTLPSGDNWAVGWAGTVTHFDGAQWSGSTAIAPVNFYGVYASSNSDVWAAGAKGTLVHYNGTAWSTATSPTTNDIHGMWGTSTSQVWAVGLAGTVLSWNGSAWSKVTVPTTQDLYGIFGTSASDVWVVGNTVILHYNGTSWSSTTTTTALLSVWAASPTAAWAVGQSGAYQWNGTAWTTLSGVYGSSIFGSSATDVWSAFSDQESYHFNGSSWTQAAINPGFSPEPFGAITGTGGVMLAAGADGMMYRYVGGTWYRVSTGITQRNPDVLNLRQGVVASPTDVFVSGSKSNLQGFGSFGYVLNRSAKGVVASLADTTVSAFSGIAASSGTDAWTGDGTSVEHDVSGTWTAATTPSTVSLTSLAAFSPSDAWAAGGEVTVHWNGTVWSNVTNAFTGSGMNVTAIGGSGTSDIWAGADSGYLMHWNGSFWGLPTTIAPSKVVRVSVPAGGAAMAAGAYGVVRWDGADWVNAGFTKSTTSVWAASATEAWALAFDSSVPGSRLYHWNGTTWTESSPGVLFGFPAIDVGGSGSVAWAFGQGGQLLHRP